MGKARLRRSGIVVTALLLSLGPWAGAAVAGGDQPREDSAVDLPAGVGHRDIVGGDFISRCPYVTVDPGTAGSSPTTPKIGPIDPILAPYATSAHDHMFFGNARTTSSPEDTPQGPPMQRTRSGDLVRTSCQDSHDTASYWFPELFKLDAHGVPQPDIVPGAGHRPLPPQQSTVVWAYYSNAVPVRDARTLQDLPASLMMVAGFPMATLESPPPLGRVQRQVFWDCGSGHTRNATPASPWPYRCQDTYGTGDLAFHPDGAVAHVVFPNCYRPGPGHGPLGHPVFVSPDVRPQVNDLEYGASDGSCPVGTVYIPQITLRLHTQDMDPCGGAMPCCPGSFRDPAQCAGTAANVRFRFATMTGPDGSFYSLHADLWNTWDTGTALPVRQGTLASLTEDCLRHRTVPVGHVCGFVRDDKGYP